MNHVLLSFLLIGVSMIGTSTAIAQNVSHETSPYAKPGVYLGIGGLYAIENFDFATGVQVDDGLGFNFRLGYRLAPHWALELMGEHVDSFDITNGVSEEIESWAGTFNGKFFFLTEQFQPYGLVGVGVHRIKAKIRTGFGNDQTETGGAVRLGGGLDSYITENWVVNAELTYLFTEGDAERTDYFSLSAGIQYRF